MQIIGYTRMFMIDLLRGTNVLSKLSILNREQYKSFEELEKIAADKQSKLFSLAKRAVPFYRNITITNNFPVLTKDVIRSHFGDLIPQNYKGKLIPKATGGSTGLPLRYFTTPEAQSFMWAGIIHSWKMVGYALGDKVAFVAGTAIAKKDYKHEIFYRLMNVDVYSAYELNEDSISQYLSSLKAKKVKVIYGYPTAINQLALHLLQKSNFDFPDLKGIVVTSEVLMETHRRNIEEAFGVVVRNQYGCNEAGLSAFECEFGNLHLINTASRIEIDEHGNVMSTNLVNKGFVFINYFTGDQFNFSPVNKCSCRRGYPIINEVKGRSVDLIIDTQNKQIHPAFFSILFRNSRDVEQFQIQYDDRNIDIYLKLTEPIGNKDFGSMLNCVKEHMAFDKYRIITNSPFLTSQNAKHRYVIDNRKNKNHENLV
ncbi:MAG: hypothetical protein RLZ10_159 [Bacteroidota bacterium]